MSHDDGRKTKTRLWRSGAPVLACILALGVAACGGDDGKSASQDDDGRRAKLSGTVTVWDYDYKLIPGQTKAVNKLDAEFERMHPGVDVKRVAQPLDNYDQLIQAAFTGRKTPDVIKLFPGELGVLRWKKGLKPLDESVTPEMREKLDGWEVATADGKVYGVPVAYQGYVFYYNKKLFEKAGLPAEFKPKTWDELKAAAQKLKAAGVQPFTGGNKEGYENLWWFAAAWPSFNTKEQARKLSDGEIPLTDDVVAKAVAPNKTMQDAGLFEEDRFTTPMWPDGVARLGSGRGAMFLGLYSGSTSGRVHNKELGEENVGMFFPPGQKYVAVYPDHTYAVPSAAANQEAAEALIEFLASRKGVQTQYDVGGLLPNHDEVEVSANAPYQDREILEAIRSQETGPDMQALIPGAVQFGPMTTELNEYLQGRKSLEEVQKSMQNVAEKAAN